MGPGVRGRVQTMLDSQSPPPFWPKPPTRLRDVASAVAVGRWLGLVLGLSLAAGCVGDDPAGPGRIPSRLTTVTWFESVEAMEQSVPGMEEGLRAAMPQLDAVLAERSSLPAHT